MRRSVLLAVFWAVALALPAVIAPAEPAPALAPAARDWTATVVQTAEGGFRMGNPDARIKLVVYASITCPHCATFAASGTEPLMADYVRGGQVSWEYRPFLIFPSDPGIFQLLACRGPTEFSRWCKLYSSQAEWAGRLGRSTRKRALRPENSSKPAHFPFGCPHSGGALVGFSTPERHVGGGNHACLADEAELRASPMESHGIEQDRRHQHPDFLHQRHQARCL
jgi:hypothetical protein